MEQMTRTWTSYQPARQPRVGEEEGYSEDSEGWDLGGHVGKKSHVIKAVELLSRPKAAWEDPGTSIEYRDRWPWP